MRVFYNQRVENIVSSLLEDHIPGGLAPDTDDNSPYDPDELAMGIEVELEHTPDREIAAEIARDHLEEDPTYESDLVDCSPSDSDVTVLFELYGWLCASPFGGVRSRKRRIAACERRSVCRRLAPSSGSA